MEKRAVIDPSITKPEDGCRDKCSCKCNGKEDKSKQLEKLANDTTKRLSDKMKSFLSRLSGKK